MLGYAMDSDSKHFTLYIQTSAPPRTTNTQQSDGTGNEGMDMNLGIGAGIGRAMKPLTSNIFTSPMQL
jgi:hypothetical protein